MKAYRNLLGVLLAVLALQACSDDDSFSSSPGQYLEFSADTIRLDTCFSTVPTPMKSFWVYNRSGDGIRLESIRLERGNQSGFRVNVDGVYLGAQTGYQTNQIEVRNKDSVRVFVELTSMLNYQTTLTKLEDNIVFTLENGNIQKVNLLTYTWDATLLYNTRVRGDSTIDSSRPVVIYGGLRVDSLATLTIAAGTTLYFHNDAGIDVYGRLIAAGTAESNVVLRGDRIDHMFDYLPYDRVSGQWQGIRFHESSYENHLLYTDIHSTYDGIVVDSSDVDRQKLLIESSTIHNCQGYGLVSANSKIGIRNTQITNTLNDCLAVFGGNTEINHCTLAQFYPFDANRGVALRFTSTKYPLQNFNCSNTLVTGYADDQLMGELGDEEDTPRYYFDHCIIRTPRIETVDSIYFNEVVYENTEDTTSMGRKHFAVFDTENLFYDFQLDSVSIAIDKADPENSLPLDRNGNMRDTKPDVGAYEYRKKGTIEPQKTNLKY
ncbi:MAG: right-handed parallel beta-helix repeat-containing protein [Prevotella sp.]|nr:right-handed parallel beta-helix repeat-containing protein [Prevotella sp.]